MGETRDHLEAHGGPGTVLCGKTGTFIIDSRLCDDCPRRACREAGSRCTPALMECDECRGECPDWQGDE